MKNQLGQCTLRLANIRPGLRRIVFRNERDNKENPMAIALVEIRTYTLAEIEERTEMHKARIEVWIMRIKSYLTKYYSAPCLSHLRAPQSVVR